MAVLICGSLAFDTIMTFEGRFAEQILPDQLHILNVSFLVPSLRRDFGGCAGNIAYSLQLLGGKPLPMAMLGSDGADYLSRLKELGISTAHVGQAHDTYTAQAMIMTDRDNNQITAFHPGAMMQAHVNRIEPQADVSLGIIAPDGRDAMLEHAAQMVAADIPFVFDPGQGLPMFNGAELSRFVEQATWVTVNDYEGKMLCERTGWSCAEISRKVKRCWSEKRSKATGWYASIQQRAISTRSPSRLAGSTHLIWARMDRSSALAWALTGRPRPSCQSTLRPAKAPTW